MPKNRLGGKSIEHDTRRVRTLIPQWIYLSSPLTSTSWDGDSFSTTAKTSIDLSSVFSAPAGIKAILVTVQCRDSGSAAGNPWAMLSPNNTAGSGMRCRAAGIANDSRAENCMMVPCDSNGDVYYQLNATGASTLDVWIEIWGYAI
jgi:hypothetical protein